MASDFSGATRGDSAQEVLEVNAKVSDDKNQKS
jgi:hypothetical protein